MRIEGAPIDNNILERALKIPIRGRRTWLFYKTEYGAMIGGVLTSVSEKRCLTSLRDGLFRDCFVDDIFDLCDAMKGH